MKNILILATTPFLSDGLTKIEMDVYQYCRNQMNFSFATSFTENSSFRKNLKKEGVNVFDLKKKKHVFSYMKSIYSLIGKHNFDAVYIHGNSAMMFIEALPCKLGKAKRIITHCHNSKTKYPIFHYIFKPFFNKIVDVKIGCSKTAAKWAYSGNDYRVILNGVDTEKFSFNPVMRNQMRKKLGWENNFVLGHVGRFNFQKNHEFLIRIFAEIYKKDKTARLLLIGEGELMEQVKNLSKNLGVYNAIHFAGISDHVEDYFQAMDVFVLPSLFEGFVIVSLEAQRNGLPSILSDTVDAETFVTDNAVSMSLQQSPSEWADVILKYKGKKRMEYSEVFRNKKLDFNSMMESIKQILDE